MKTSNLEKAYPELKDLPHDMQSKILERAENEINEEGKTLFWGTKLVLVGALIGTIIYSILYFIFKGDGQVPLIGSIIAVTFSIMVVNKRNIKLLHPKVRELVLKEKI